MLFCAIDSDVKGWKTAGLRAKKKLRGLPSVVFLGLDGEPLIYVPFKNRSVATIQAT